MGPLFESPPRPSLKSNLQPLDRYDTCQETISNRCILHLPQVGMAWGGAIIQVGLG